MISIKEVSKIYQNDTLELKALDNIDLYIADGESVSIIGASGSGKSTLMNIIGCLDSHFDGEYHLNNSNVKSLDRKQLSVIRNKVLGFIFQQYNLIQELTVLENVELPLLYRGINGVKRRSLAISALKKVELLDKENQYPNQLSGGQQQRVSIARALAGNPSVILADEPTGALDSKTGDEIISLLQQLNNNGITVIIITHDMNIAKKMNRIITLKDGKIISDMESDRCEF